MNRRNFLHIGSMSFLAGGIAPVLAAPSLALSPLGAEDGGSAHAAFLENEQVRIGINLDWGGAIFYFSRKHPERNLVNHHDAGRLIQQSYYGDKDGSWWSGKPWRWNPVQGGGCDGEKAKVLEARITSSKMYVKTEPKLWATGADVPDATMEEWITLQGECAHVHFKFTYSGSCRNAAVPQEVPAVFMDYALSDLVFYAGKEPWQGDSLTHKKVGWPNEQINVDESWAAFIDESGWGLGVYFPGTSEITTYRFTPQKNLTAGPEGNACSYFAPIKRLAIVPGMTHEYDIALAIGKAAEIRTAFYRLHGALVGRQSPKGDRAMDISAGF